MIMEATIIMTMVTMVMELIHTKTKTMMKTTIFVCFVFVCSLLVVMFVVFCFILIDAMCDDDAADNHKNSH